MDLKMIYLSNNVHSLEQILPKPQPEMCETYRKFHSTIKFWNVILEVKTESRS